MVSAVSNAVSPTATTAAEGDRFSYHWFKMPELNRATHRRLGQLGCGWTFETIVRLVHHVGRVGRPKAKRAARELGRLGVGLKAIAAEAGVSVNKVKRDLVHLVDLGLVAVIRRNVAFKVDPATGKIRENRTGRSLPVVVCLTIGPEHCREKPGKAGKAKPAAACQARVAPTNPSIVDRPGMHDRVHPGGAIQRDRNTERRPDGDAVGIGTPPAAPEAGLAAGQAPASREPAATASGLPGASQGRLPAAKAAGHAAGKASQERVIVRVDAAEDDPLVPIGQRVSRPAAAPPRPQRQPGGRQQFPEDHRGPQAWTGTDAARAAATQRRLEAERLQREAEDAELRQAREAVSR
jgi:hypothetical protein